MKKISIVSAYYNRKEQLINTLKSINKSSFKNIEYIIVDDCSDDEHRIEDLKNTYDFIKVIRLEPENRWYINPCVPFNIGFKEITGDIVLIQNPECLHLGDILNFTHNNFQENEYLSFSCFSIDQETTTSIINNTKNESELIELVNNSNYQSNYDGGLGWYNHPIYRPVGYHFASVISHENLKKLNGFDERYAHGIGYDDNEFLLRVKEICNFKFVSEPLVVHQYHYYPNNNFKKIDDPASKVEINRKLFYNI